MPYYRIEGRKAGRPAPWLRAASGAALATLLVCTSAGIACAGDDTMSSHTSFYDEMLQVIGFGGGTTIQYSERSPLVVPPTRDLPPPVADVPPAVPDWPKDPDLTRRAKAKVREKPRPHPDYAIESARPLTPAELNVPGPLPTSSGSHSASADAQQLNPAVTQPSKGLFSFDFLHPNKTQYATFTGEPARTSLTDPPPGYLTPSPDQPYGIGPERKQYKVPTVADRVTPSSGSEAGN